VRMRVTILFAMAAILVGTQATSSAATAFESGICVSEPSARDSDAAIAQEVAVTRPEPVPKEPAWSECLSHPDPLMCSWCCWDWKEDCQEACPDDDGGFCFTSCSFQWSHCVDACYGL
jgi:hypothetical protein